jgi:hypothetical protein
MMDKLNIYVIDDVAITTNAENYIVSETVDYVKKIYGKVDDLIGILKAIGYHVVSTDDIQVYRINE